MLIACDVGVVVAAFEEAFAGQLNADGVCVGDVVVAAAHPEGVRRGGVVAVTVSDSGLCAMWDGVSGGWVGYNEGC